ncbi:hypothetical protein [Streptomyces chromofuscus]|uniref:Uncharacterized protein n=1 Tax=Streptomyces chromofuscus TaxID=42881 RepID=A0A7M2T260_STRCW|nr:hypothetical protein [Streptomyces chromofuscus]QOV41963.1 hypothetical protein IPT68_18940 [Streptomyces chromofuscus]GGS86862.1 hypothetical protein GCM10010254_03330 [Streptomyces chromofuscus]
MADKSPAELEKEIDRLRAELHTKANSSSLAGLTRKNDIESAALKSDKEVLATQSWVQNETKPKLWEAIKNPEILGFVAAFTIAKLELTPLISLEPAIEKFFERKGIERNKWGILRRLKADELERRRQEAAAAETRLTRLEQGTARLQDNTTSAHNKIANSNRRIQTLEGKVAGLVRTDRKTRRNVRESLSSRDLATARDRVSALETRVNALTVALG